MTLFNLRRLARLWQKRLRISDWKVDIAFGAEEEMNSEGEECDGWTRYDPRDMTAIIRIAPNLDHENYSDGGYEQTIIHELLHIVLHGECLYEKEDISQERKINIIADALYFAYRPKLKGAKAHG